MECATCIFIRNWSSSIEVSFDAKAKHFVMTEYSHGNPPIFTHVVRAMCEEHFRRNVESSHGIVTEITEHEYWVYKVMDS
jgi:hypothetical protein